MRLHQNPKMMLLRLKYGSCVTGNRLDTTTCCRYDIVNHVVYCVTNSIVDHCINAAVQHIFYLPLASRPLSVAHHENLISNSQDAGTN